MSTEEKAVALVARIFPERVPAKEFDVHTVAVLLKIFVPESADPRVLDCCAARFIEAVDILRRERSCIFLN